MQGHVVLVSHISQLQRPAHGPGANISRLFMLYGLSAVITEEILLLYCDEYVVALSALMFYVRGFSRWVLFWRGKD